MQRKAFLQTVAGSLLATTSSLLRAQESFPAGKVVRVVVPFAAGSSTDLLAREFTRRLSETLKTTVVVENRSGAGGIVGTQSVVNAAPDGLTLVMGTIGILAINEHMYSRVPYDVGRQLTPVVQVASVPNFLICNASLPPKNLPEFVAYLRASPGRTQYASPGVGTSPHLAAELLKFNTGTFSVHIPYRGGAEAIGDVVANRCQFMFTSGPGSVPFIKQGLLRAIAMGGATRDPAHPDLPTFMESGLPAFKDFAVTAWIGLMAPAGVPEPVVARLTRASNDVLGDPAMKSRFVQMGARAEGGSPQAFALHIRNESRKWAEVVKRANIKVDA